MLVLKMFQSDLGQGRNRKAWSFQNPKFFILVSFETTFHVLRSKIKICIKFFTFDTFESNVIMADVREIDGLKKLIVKFKNIE